MKLCRHPNVLSMHTSFVVDNELWMVMPYMAKGACWRHRPRAGAAVCACSRVPASVYARSLALSLCACAVPLRLCLPVCLCIPVRLCIPVCLCCSVCLGLLLPVPSSVRPPVRLSPVACVCVRLLWCETVSLCFLSACESVCLHCSLWPLVVCRLHVPHPAPAEGAQGGGGGPAGVCVPLSTSEGWGGGGGSASRRPVPYPLVPSCEHASLFTRGGAVCGLDFRRSTSPRC
jgi:hypothetical protein